MKFLKKALGAWSSGMAHRMFGHVNGNLGDTIDIHGGGADPSFHHTNEIAQSEAKEAKFLPITGCTMALSLTMSR